MINFSTIYDTKFDFRLGCDGRDGTSLSSQGSKSILIMVRMIGHF